MTSEQGVYNIDPSMEFAVPNCLESATYDPAKSLSDARNGTIHQFQVNIIIVFLKPGAKVIKLFLSVIYGLLY